MMKASVLLFGALAIMAILYFSWESNSIQISDLYEAGGTLLFLVGFFAVTYGLSRLFEFTKSRVEPKKK